MNSSAAARLIEQGRAVLGLELGSTRIKAVLIGDSGQPLAVGSSSWENQLVDSLWTYSLESVWAGVQASVASLLAEVHRSYGVQLTLFRAMGVSAMMHGYLPFGREGELLTPFRTWRNTSTAAAVEELSQLFTANIPHRWSVAHLYQAILDGEEHVHRISHLTTLAGYVHWQLSGEQVLGIGDASGMFPLDSRGQYSTALVDAFEKRVADRGLVLRLAEVLPAIRSAGEPAGELTPAGARMLDPSGALRSGTAMCPPEGDAGTGMVATNSVTPRTGNVSAGTSIFAMVVLERALEHAHPEIDVVATPAGDPVAMVHCNNGASELDAWAGLFTEFAATVGAPVDRSQVFQILIRTALLGAADGGGLMAFNYLAGEPITGIDQGRPMVLRSPNSTLDLATFMRTQLYASLATLRLGMDVLRSENVRLDTLFAHGGLFTTRGVAQRFLAAALDTSVSVGTTASEGGPWGMALLAAFLVDRAPDQTLADYLSGQIFRDIEVDTVFPDHADVAGFDAFLQRYVQALPVQRAAADHTL